MFLSKEEITNAVIPNNDEIPETPVIINEPETTEVVPSIEPNPDVIPVVPEIAPPMQDIPVQHKEFQKTPCCTCTCEDMTIGKYFGTLIESVKISWQYHLKSKKNSEHTILEEYYEDVKKLIDSLIEEYQGINGIVDNYENCICSCEKTPIVYFQELRTFVESNREIVGDYSEIQSDVDSILSKIDSTLYKLTNLVESIKPFMYFEEFEKINR